MTWSARTRRDGQSGTTALEFALIAMPLLLFTFGIFEFARALFLQQSMSYATDQAARVLYVNPAANPASLETTILAGLEIGDPALLDITITPTTQEGLAAIRFDLVYDFHFVVPSIMPNGIDITHSRVVIVGE